MPQPEIVRTVAGIRQRVDAWRAAGETVALVPTMGALHAGHAALVRAARENADRVLVSVFVNPRQFGPTEDLARYPRDEAADVAKLGPLRVDAVYAPTVEEMYPDGFATTVAPSGPAEGLETDFRPHFFAGVATVCAKLFLQCLPDLATFGEKDYQQLKVVTRMARDLDLRLRILPVPTLREADGLALSSRNAYLSGSERALAPMIHAVLRETAARIAADEDAVMACADGSRKLAEAGFAVDYLAARHAETLAPVSRIADGPLRLLVAARIGGTRLIDNIAV